MLKREHILWCVLCQRKQGCMQQTVWHCIFGIKGAILASHSSGSPAGESIASSPRRDSWSLPPWCQVVIYAATVNFDAYVYKVAPPVRWALVLVVNSLFTAIVKSISALKCVALCWRLAGCVFGCLPQAFHVLVSCLTHWLVREPGPRLPSLGAVEGAPLWTSLCSAQQLPHLAAPLYTKFPLFFSWWKDGVGVWDAFPLICQVLHY